MPWPSINPGELRHEVTIQQATATTDVSGATVGLSDFTTAMVKIEWTNGSEPVQAGQVSTQSHPLITMRYQPGILPNMVVVARTGSYTIQYIEDVNEMNVLLKLHCLALGANR
jgi:SPP1 family predicted phage head-tail adaptor